MRRLAVLAVVVLAGCSSGGGGGASSSTSLASSFDVEAAKAAWLVEVAPFVPDDPTLDAAIASVERGCLADSETEAPLVGGVVCDEPAVGEHGPDRRGDGGRVRGSARVVRGGVKVVTTR